ncbi:MAG TPA: 50S ribosomal protein L17 [Candidatus Omnitrophota bacterium]|nr:50S ribosomal protein L17 [Candidatus Omnitrophota bacterium]HNQ51134.1 50S ribosomal protein L17 [Candidatus Omnitrophota bacterium]HQO38029.1 50S ribosomal protein L17 [Candidatus Omnitrophota bacterium]
MRHRKAKHQFSRRTAWRTATVKSLIRALFAHGSIHTTLTRAKAAQPVAEKLISWAKDGTLDKKRRAFSELGEHALVKTLFGDIAPRYKSHASGFTRILRMENRRGDDAQMVLFQLTELPVKEKTEKHKKKEKESKGASSGEGAAAKQHEEKSKPGHPEAAKPAAPEIQPPKKQAKPPKKFLGGIRGIFKKERDSL